MGNYLNNQGQPIVTKAASNQYKEGWDRIFGKKEVASAHVWTSCNSGVEICDRCDAQRSADTEKSECVPTRSDT